jgi:hypothetical protein
MEHPCLLLLGTILFLFQKRRQIREGGSRTDEGGLKKWKGRLNIELRILVELWLVFFIFFLNIGSFSLEQQPLMGGHWQKHIADKTRELHNLLTSTLESTNFDSSLTMDWPK